MPKFLDPKGTHSHAFQTYQVDQLEKQLIETRDEIKKLKSQSTPTSNTTNKIKVLQQHADAIDGLLKSALHSAELEVTDSGTLFADNDADEVSGLEAIISNFQSRKFLARGTHEDAKVIADLYTTPRRIRAPNALPRNPTQTEKDKFDKDQALYSASEAARELRTAEPLYNNAIAAETILKNTATCTNPLDLLTTPPFNSTTLDATYIPTGWDGNTNDGNAENVYVQLLTQAQQEANNLKNAEANLNTATADFTKCDADYQIALQTVNNTIAPTPTDQPTHQQNIEGVANHVLKNGGNKANLTRGWPPALVNAVDKYIDAFQANTQKNTNTTAVQQAKTQANASLEKLKQHIKNNMQPVLRTKIDDTSYQPNGYQALKNKKDLAVNAAEFAKEKEEAIDSDLKGLEATLPLVEQKRSRIRGTKFWYSLSGLTALGALTATAVAIATGANAALLIGAPIAAIVLAFVSLTAFLIQRYRDKSLAGGKAGLLATLGVSIALGIFFGAMTTLITANPIMPVIVAFSLAVGSMLTIAGVTNFKQLANKYPKILLGMAGVIAVISAISLMVVLGPAGGFGLAVGAGILAADLTLGLTVPAIVGAIGLAIYALYKMHNQDKPKAGSSAPLNASTASNSASSVNGGGTAGQVATALGSNPANGLHSLVRTPSPVPINGAHSLPGSPVQQQPPAPVEHAWRRKASTSLEDRAAVATARVTDAQDTSQNGGPTSIN